MLRQSLVIMLAIIATMNASSKEYHVAKTGDDTNEGTSKSPFRTIAKAARIALPGDTITVHEGTYREWVRPMQGGLNDDIRITYRAAENEEVTIKGSEIIKGWKKEKNGTWKVVLDNSFFGDYNPYDQLIRGDWFIPKEMLHHTGEVYLNDQSLYEVDTLRKILDTTLLNDQDEFSKYKWYCEVSDKQTTIWANFGNVNPNSEQVEINVRPACFFPETTRVDYITVRGFKMSQAATQWAPPTAEQIGLLGPNWSKGWIIENNEITHSKCSGISLGKERSTGQNEWTNIRTKHGTQYEREVVFNALKAGWSRETIGSHIVRNNTIYECGQTGICGHLGAIFSEIYENHIYDINRKDQFGGFEIAGIKIHAGIDILIASNLIHDAKRGIWMDWQAQGARLTRNVLFDNVWDDFLIEVCHGPHLIDHNILLSKFSLKNWSQGGAYVHNLLGGLLLSVQVNNRFTQYHYPHSTDVAGLMTIQGGDDRFYNNIFLKPREAIKPKLKNRGYGLVVFNSFPLVADDWIVGKTVVDYEKHKYPVTMEGNLYLNGAIPFQREIKHKVDSTSKAFDAEIVKKADGFYLKLTVGTSYQSMETQVITTSLLDKTIQAEALFEDTDGSRLFINTDFNGNKRSSSPIVGPFEHLKEDNLIKVWPPAE